MNGNAEGGKLCSEEKKNSVDIAYLQGITGQTLFWGVVIYAI